MQEAENLISPAQLARCLGLGESTVKRWIDLGRLEAMRTPGGHRRIPLRAAIRFIRNGHFSLFDPAALGLAAAGPSDPSVLAERLVDATPDRVVSLLEGLYAGGLGAAELADAWIAPAMERVGHGWEQGAVSVTTEHLATSAMVRALHALLRTHEVGLGPRAFVAAPPADPYVIPGLCAELVLRDGGFQVSNCGPDTPLESLAASVNAARPRLLALSVSSHAFTGNGGSRARAALGAACRDSGAALVVGGRGVSAELAEELGATAWCRSMRELEQLALHVRGVEAPAQVRSAG